MKQNQEAFNVMVRHLRKQGAKSQIFNTDQDRMVCQYRGDKGRKCAVGALIKDSVYYDELEGSCLTDKFEEALRRSGWTGVSGGLLVDTQDVHDHSAVFDWENGLALVAERYDLTVPEKDETDVEDVE